MRGARTSPRASRCIVSEVVAFGKLEGDCARLMWKKMPHAFPRCRILCVAFRLALIFFFTYPGCLNLQVVLIDKPFTHWSGVSVCSVGLLAGVSLPVQQGLYDATVSGLPGLGACKSFTALRGNHPAFACLQSPWGQ